MTTLTKKEQKILNNKLFQLCTDLAEGEDEFEKEVEKLLDQGANLESMFGVFNNTPLFRLCLKVKSVSLLEFFLEKGANFKYIDLVKDTALHMLCRNSHVNIEMIDFLLNQNIDINAVGFQKLTALDILDIHKSDVDNLHFLIERGAFISKKIYAKLPSGITKHCVKKDDGYLYIKPKVILSSQEQINMFDRFKEICSYSPILYDELKKLIDQGLDVNYIDNEGYYCSSFLQKIIVYNYVSVPLLQFFLDNGANFKYLDKSNDSVLHCACRNNKITTEMITFLLNQGLDLNQRGYSNRDVLNTAIHNNLPDNILLFLIKCGSDVYGTTYNKLSPTVQSLLVNRNNIYLYNPYKNHTKHTNNNINDIWKKELEKCIEEKIPFIKELVLSNIDYKNSEQMEKEFLTSKFPHDLCVNNFLESIKDLCDYEIEYGCNYVKITVTPL